MFLLTNRRTESRYNDQARLLYHTTTQTTMTQRETSQQQQQHPSGSISSSRVLAARIASSSAGSIITSLVVHPLDVVKVRLQKSAALAGAMPCPAGCGTVVLQHQAHEHALRSNRGEVRQTIQMMQHIFRTEGTSGLYRGLRPTLIMAFPSTAIYYTSYEELATRLRQKMHQQRRNQHRRDEITESTSTWVIPIVAGGSARLLASTITAPLEYLRTIQAASSSRHHSVGGVLEQLSKIILEQSTNASRNNNGGWRTLYRGIGPTLMRDVPFSSIYWLSLEKLREGQRQYTESSASSRQIPQLVFDFTNGAIAGMIAAGVTTPADVLKTRLQTVSDQRHHASSQGSNVACGHDGAKPVAKSSSSATTSRQVLAEILEREGFRGLWRGSVARVLKVAPACAIMISSYELGKRLLEAN